VAANAGADTLHTAMTEPWKIAPKAKRAIYISLIGAPSQLDLFDYKPALQGRFKEDLKDYLGGQGERLTGMTAGQASFPLAPTIFKFAQHGQSGMWISELLPNIAKMSDDLCFIRSMKTDAINHEPANQLVYTGSMQNGKASIGSWLSYGLGTLNADLPSFVVLHAKHTSPFSNVQAISSRSVGQWFLPGEHAGVSLRPQGDPVLYLNDAPGIPRELRRRMLDGLGELNRRSYESIGDPEIHDPHRSNTRWPSACRPACRNSPISPEKRRHLRTLRRRGAHARLVCELGVDGAAPRRNAACGFVQIYPPRLGPARQPAARHRRPSATTSTARASASCRI